MLPCHIDIRYIVLLKQIETVVVSPSLLAIILSREGASIRWLLFF